MLLIVIAATLNLISDGMQFAWTAPIVLILQSEDSPVPIQKSDVEWLENIYVIGGFAGLPISIFCVNKFGRKNSILIGAGEGLISWLIIAVTPSVTYLYVARFISGMAADVAFIAVPMYIGEISNEKNRGSLIAVLYFMLQIGIIMVYSVAPFAPISISSAVGASFLVLQLITLPFMPESPYFLLLQGKLEEAKISLQILRSSQDIERELGEIQAAVERQSHERGRPIDLILVDSNRKALIITTALDAGQHFSSFIVILMNLHTILGDADSILAPNTAAIIYSVVLLIATIAAASAMDKAGRKILLVVSGISTGMSLIAIASYFTAKNSGVDVSAYNWIPVAAVMAFAAAFKIGLGTVPLVLTAELFPTSVKAIGVTLTDAMYVLFSLASLYLFQQLSHLYGMHVPFYTSAVSCFLTAIFTLLYIPETKGKTLEEIQIILKGVVQPNPIKRKNSSGQKIEGIVNEAADVIGL